MPQTFTDQFYLLDPSAPPAPGTAVNFVNYTITDQNDDNDFDRFDNDSVNGSDITSSYPGDTVTINVPGVGNVTYTGITFYLANGQVVFTPTDGQVLQNGTFVSSTFVNTQGPLLVSQLGPPCFTAGTMIAVPGGEVPVEDLKAGDLVETLDNGPQPLRWIGRQEVVGTRNLAPVRIEAGTLGNARDLRVSQQHRMLVRGWQAELHFGKPEVLIAAKHLRHLDGVSEDPCERVEYIHLLFDRHEIVYSEGAPSESLHPGGYRLNDDPELLEEIAEIFPEIMDMVEAGETPAARPVATGREALVLTN